MPKSILYIIISLFIISAAAAQDSQEYRLAQSYEQSGDFENAARIYEGLYNKKRGSEIYFEGLVRSYKALNQYTRLLEITEKHIERKPSADNYILYGELLWRAGKTQEANAAWDKVIESEGDSPKTYEKIVDAQIALRLFNKAIETFHSGRNNLNSSTVFANNLSQLYIATGNFELGAEETLNLFETAKNLALAQGRLSALMSSEEAKIHIGKALRDKEESTGGTGYKKLLAWYYRVMEDYGAAFELYKEIDEMSKSQGHEIYMFATDSRRDGQYDIALKAFEYLLGKGKKYRNFQQALYGYVRTLEYKFTAGGKADEQQLREVISQYGDIAEDYPGTSFSCDCRFRMAAIYHEKLAESANAIEQLEILMEKCRAGILHAAAANLLGDIYLAMGELGKAEEKYKDVAGNLGRQNYDEKEKAEYKLAELKYYLGKMEEAEADFNKISSNPQSDFSNDALKKSGIIMDNKDTPKALLAFAEAELSERQNKLSEAVEKYISIKDMPSNETLAELAMIRASDIERARGRGDEAVKLLKTLLADYPDSIYGDYAYFSLGEIYLKRGEKEISEEYFMDILTKYPNSIYLQQARNMIRKIRGGKSS